MPKKTNYKKIFIEDLPKWQAGEFEGCINWCAIRNTPVRFQYNDTYGVFIAKYFDKSKERILVEYEGNDIWCHRSTFKRSNISRIIGKIQSDFRYNIGDKYINENVCLTIVDRVKNGRKKMYKYQCNRCGLDLRKPTYRKGILFDYWVSETNLSKGIGCSCCSSNVNQVVQPGINDIFTTDKWMIPYFENEDDAHIFSHSSEFMMKFKCPDCGHIIEKEKQIGTIYRTKSVGCPICSDGKSYPEKFIASYLRQIGEPFITEYSAKWSNNRRYDFYLPNMNTFIEVDGGIGHGKKTYDNKSDTDGLRIDNEKDENAMLNIEAVVVRVNADKSEMGYMKDSIKKSLGDIFDDWCVDYYRCEKDALSSKVIQSGKLFKSGKSIPDIADNLDVSEHTVRRYLSRCYELNICEDYHIRKRG